MIEIPSGACRQRTADVDLGVETGVVDSGGIDLDAVFGAGDDATGAAADSAQDPVYDASGDEPAATDNEFDFVADETMFGPHTETQEITPADTSLDLDLGALDGLDELDDTAIGTGPDVDEITLAIFADDADDEPMTDAPMSDAPVESTDSAADSQSVGESDAVSPQTDNVIPFSSDASAGNDAANGFDDVEIDVSDTLIEKSHMLERLIEDAANRFAQQSTDDAAGMTVAIDADGQTPPDTSQPTQPSEADDEGQDDVAAEPVAQEPAGAPEESAETLPDNVATLVPGGPVPARDTPREKIEYSRVDSRLLEDMLNAAGEISIYMAD